MRMRGLEPPRTCIHTDLNRARLPIPPHPRERQGEDIAPSGALDTGARPAFGQSCPRADRPSRRGALLASCSRLRAAIVQGTRTPPSHGGNPGSNPGSGTPKVPASGQVFSLSRPLTASPLGERSAARWGAEHRVTGRRRPAHPISACRSGVWPGEGSSEACARPGCRRRSVAGLSSGGSRKSLTAASRRV